MKLDKNLLNEIATNARLKLTKKEEKEFLPQLEEIMEVFSQLDEVKTHNVQPSFHPIKVENVAREDKITKCLSTTEVFKDVKNKEDSFFKGPKPV